MQKRKPTEEVRKAAQEVREESVRAIVAREDIFPPHLLMPTGGAAERVNHLTWVLRYRLAHRSVEGLAAFKGTKGERISSYEWAGWKTDTNPRQIEEDISNVYTDDSPQQTFQKHLEEFVKAYNKRESLC